MGSLHELTSKGVNDGDDELSRLPAPKLTLLTRHDVFSIEHALLVKRILVFGPEVGERSASGEDGSRIPVFHLPEMPQATDDAS